MYVGSETFLQWKRISIDRNIALVKHLQKPYKNNKTKQNYARLTAVLFRS